MDLQVLVATMDQEDHSLLERMNINSAAIIGNQCDRNEIEQFDHKGYSVTYLSFEEVGVALNRNNALMRARADLCLFSDDDVVLYDQYRDLIIESFQKYKSAHVILFNLDEEKFSRFIIRKPMRIRYYNYMRYGTPRIACRRESITRSGISFNLHFGGGAEYNAGEDTLFLHACLKNKLKVIALPISIGRLENTRQSSWFRGYDDKYFFDKGALFSAISRPWASFLCLQFLIRKRKRFRDKVSLPKAYRLMREGAGSFYQKMKADREAK